MSSDEYKFHEHMSSDEYKFHSTIDVPRQSQSWIPKERDTKYRVVPSELSKEEKVKRTNRSPKYVSYNETTKSIIIAFYCSE